VTWEDGRLDHLAEAGERVRAVLRQVEDGTCDFYSRDECLEELHDIAVEAGG
jgi:hypothetical protein